MFLGMCPKALRPHVKEIHQPVPFLDYPAKLASLDLDLAVAPLEHNRFNEAKSNLRVLEYGALGVPAVCSDIEPYRSAPVVRVPNTKAAWVQAIRERVHDLDAAEREGARLREWVWKDWALEDHLGDWLDALHRKPLGGSGTTRAPGALGSEFTSRLPAAADNGDVLHENGALRA